MSSWPRHSPTASRVYVPDRRGRGLSGPYGRHDSIRQEVEDLAALLAGTGARDVFGVSSGADHRARGRLTIPGIRRLAAFEPPLFEDDALPIELLTRFDAEMAEGRVAAALITAMKGAQMGPPLFNRMPRWISERLSGAFMASEERKDLDGYVPMRVLAPAMHYDFRLVAEASGRLERFGAIPRRGAADRWQQEPGVPQGSAGCTRAGHPAGASGRAPGTRSRGVMGPRPRRPSGSGRRRAAQLLLRLTARSPPDGSRTRAIASADAHRDRSPPSASPTPRPVASPTSSTPSRGRSASWATRSTSTCRTIAG